MTRENDRPGRIQFAEEEVQGARIKVVGVGGGGGNAISRMMASGLQGIEFIAVNTDLQALRANRAPVKIQVGAKLTKGLGAGANPDVGRQAAIEDTEKICDALEGRGAEIDEECRGLLDAVRRMNDINRKLRNMLAANVHARLSSLTGNVAVYEAARAPALREAAR